MIGLTLRAAPRPKKKLDIEKLLHWAYRDELPKTTTGASHSSWDSLLRFGELGARIDDQIGPSMPGFPAIMGEPHPDARVIARHVRDLKDSYIDWHSSKDAIMGDLVALAPESGWSILVAALRTQALVTMHASMGTRPDWTSEQPVPHRVLGPNGKPVVQHVDGGKQVIEGRLKSRHYGPGSRCPVRWEPEPQSIALGRAEYAAWRSGLAALVVSLKDCLSEHEALLPRAAIDPWNNGAEPQSRVLQSANVVENRVQALKPQRSAPSMPYKHRVSKEVRYPLKEKCA